MHRCRKSSAVTFHGFADDSQLVNHMLVNEINAGKNAMIDCITDIELRYRSHALKLNADKSDVIWLGSRQQLASGSLWASETVRNLGVIIDQHLTFEAQARGPARRRVFINFGAYDKSNGSLTTRHCSYWSRHSLPHAWTIVTHYWRTAV